MREMLDNLLDIAKHAARVAATIHSSRRRAGLSVHTKSSSIDLVTEIDRESEREIVTVIRSARPDDSIVGEEGTSIAGSSGVSWIIDPLDGTTNFIHQYPAHAVSVGVEINDRRVLGVVHDTFHDIVYEGIVDVGAQCDGKPIAVSTESQLSRALIGTGFLPNIEVRRMQAEVLGKVLPLVRDIRRSGCPSLDLCAVASGRLDGFYESGLGRWDIAAGAAIAEAAGAKVMEFSSFSLPSPLLVVANRKLNDGLAAELVKIGACVN
jgi:myo-inositol-1(or 4)-monophosphatase